MRYCLAFVVLLAGCDGSCGSAAQLASSASQPVASDENGVALRAPTSWQGTERRGWKRARLAYKNKLTEVMGMFQSAGVAFPPRQLFLRGFKKEKQLEVWASANRTGALTHVATYGVCDASGTSGPKTREGDGQVPEGFYAIDYYNKNSSYYLSMRVNYPNHRDRRLRHTGTLIMIHGNCASIGCLAMTDERIQELWVMADSARRHNQVSVKVHIFPTRKLTELIASTSDNKMKSFWTNLQEGYDYFEKNHRLPQVSSDRGGKYLFR